MRALQARQTAFLGCAKVAILVLQVALSVALLLVYLPPNPFSLGTPLQLRLYPLAASVLPQGWGFFTKSPRDESFQILRLEGRSWTDGFRGPESEPRNAFGFSRFPRAQGSDVAALVSELGPTSASGCSAALADCLLHERPIQVDETNRSDFTLCGDLVLRFVTPIPWAWASQFSKISRRARTFRLFVKCR